jgi:GNAT superfamily N-acetyltransferase
MGVQIRPVVTPRDRRAFIRLPWRLHANEGNWVPPLVSEVRKRLDPARNPWFRHAEAQLYLAERGGTVVGRISAHVDRHLQEFQGNRWGLFGWFTCEDDPEVAGALVATAREWVRSRGCDRLVGPMDFTTNDECGVLVEGFERPPMFLNPWNPPYYAGLLEGAGLAKAMDLLMWELEISDRAKASPIIWEIADQVERKHGIRVRSFDKRRLQDEVTRFLEVYNAAWQRNWGFVPLTEDEVRAYAKDLKLVLDENWGFLAETAEGETVAAALTLPDFNQVLRHLNGRLLPLGWAKALWYRRRIDRVRVFALGVKPEYQHTGVAARLYQAHFDSAARTPQKWGEMGWILETNKSMNRAMRGMNGRVVSRYRVFEGEV